MSHVDPTKNKVSLSAHQKHISFPNISSDFRSVVKIPIIRENSLVHFTSMSVWIDKRFFVRIWNLEYIRGRYLIL